MAEPIHICLVDDHAATREEIASLIESQPDMQVVGQAARGDESVETVRRCRPDLVVMDIVMPGLNGIDATHAIRAEQSDVHVLALSNHTGHNLVEAMLQAGAGGYVRKDRAFEELIPAIRVVVDGQIYVREEPQDQEPQDQEPQDQEPPTKEKNHDHT